MFIKGGAIVPYELYWTNEWFIGVDLEHSIISLLYQDVFTSVIQCSILALCIPVFVFIDHKHCLILNRMPLFCKVHLIISV